MSKEEIEILQDRIKSMKSFLGWSWSDVSRICGIGSIRQYQYMPDQITQFIPVLTEFDKLSDNGTKKPVNPDFKSGYSKKGVRNIITCLQAMYSVRLNKYIASVEVEVEAPNPVSASNVANAIASEVSNKYGNRTHVFELGEYDLDGEYKKIDLDS